MERPHGLPRAARLRSKRDFDELFGDGTRMHGDRMALVVRRAGTGLRLGVACGKRYSKRAVDRNRFRRLIKEVFRLHRPAFPQGYEIVVLPRCKPDQATFANFKRELPGLVARAIAKVNKNSAPAPAPTPTKSP